ncbi:TetR/AcrR family transcriptional regulator [Radicibacter daui]|uniref:TetR/AcrR family transcriptional regulator n=1 Tax=Radicibacter daui TaxID=3064829 RepID=UPI004046B8AE
MPSRPSSAPARSPGRPREFDTGAALDGAIRIFTRNGYHATSLSELTAAMNIAEGSLYKAFTNKRGVFDAALDRYIQLRIDRLADGLAKARNGHEKVATILSLYADYSQGEDGLLGCLVVGSAVDLASSEPDLAARLKAVLASHEKRLLESLEEGQADGSVASDIDAGATARLLLCLMQGMRVLGKTGRSRAEMASLVSEALRLLD